MEPTALAQALLDNRGYIVFATPMHLDVGDVLPKLLSHGRNRDLEHSTVVMAKTTFEDFAQQIRLLSTILDDQKMPTQGDFDGWNFYRLVAE